MDYVARLYEVQKGRPTIESNRIMTSIWSLIGLRMRRNIERTFRSFLGTLDLEVTKRPGVFDPPTNPPGQLGSSANLSKGQTFTERFRDIISDPVNLLIERNPAAGYLTESGNYILHNGIQVPASGLGAYYGSFSEIFMLNRGVHEPLEEFVFQELLRAQTSECSLSMLELGAYWGHYSMWFKSSFPQLEVWLVEPNPDNLAVGQSNFTANGLNGNFICEAVTNTGFSVDNFIRETRAPGGFLLHSDIQGAEVEMLRNAKASLDSKEIKYAFISTHSDDLHQTCLEILREFDYEVEIDSDFESHTTSFDGLIVARAKSEPSFLNDFQPIGRTEILQISRENLVEYISKTATNARGIR